MNTFRDQQNTECREIQEHLAEYVDNTLSARQVWEVEKHLTDCTHCTTLAHELQATVALLKTVERRDTGDDFMAKLHARLDELEPEVTRQRAPLSGIRDWVTGMRESLRVHRLPALGLGVASTALIAILTFPRAPQETPMVPPVAPAPVVIASETLHRNVALTASNPFDDPAAANLAAHVALKDSNTTN